MNAFEKMMHEAVKAAKRAEAPAEVRGFARRLRNLYVAMIQEGFNTAEVNQMMMLPLVMHLNPNNVDMMED